MKNTSIYIVALLLCCVFKIQSQEVLKLEDAVKVALENNYDIKLSKNELKIDEVSNTFGNAGMLPSVNATITNSNSILNTTQTQADGSQRTLDGAKNMNLNYGVGLDWT
ncbi:MAG: TolC family protein, partial [Bacteroidota bacterium]